MSAFQLLGAVSRSTPTTLSRAARRRVRAHEPACKPSVDTVHYGMIKRFRHRGLEALFRTGSTKGVNPQLAPKLRRALLRLSDGPLPEAMALPGFRLHPLKGDRAGVWSVWITGNYRLTFEIDGEDAINVDLEDYHQGNRSSLMEMFNPPHPGEILREDCLKPLRLTVTAAAKGLGVSRGSLSELLNGHNGISADMAIRLEKAGFGSAESWLRNQLSHDLWHARRRAKTIEVNPFPAPDSSEQHCAKAAAFRPLPVIPQLKIADIVQVDVEPFARPRKQVPPGLSACVRVKRAAA